MPTKRSLPEWSLYALLSAICLALLAWLLGVSRATLGIPLDMMRGGDIDLHGMLAKSVLDNGWVLENPLLGAPGTMKLYAYPMWDNLHLFGIKLFALFTSRYAVALNLYFYLTFPLTAISAFVVFRHFTVGRMASLVSAILYAFLPFHLLRGEGHFFLACYFVVPLDTLCLLWILQGRAFWLDGRPTREGWATFAILVLMGASPGGGYYAAFFCLLLPLAGAHSAVRRRRLKPLLVSMLAVGVVALSTAVNFLPNLGYDLHSREPALAIVRSPGEAEVYGLRLAQLLLPVTAHRVKALAALKKRYTDSAPLYNESDSSALGILGSLGFLSLLGVRLLKPAMGRSFLLFEWLGLLNAFAFLFSTIGGLGSLIALAGLTVVRAYNRVVVFIGFFSFFALALLLDRILARARGSRSALPCLLAVLLLIPLGVLDQTSAGTQPPTIDALWTNKEWDFVVGRMETVLPPGAPVFELPYTGFPETGPHLLMKESDQFRPYLHSHTLRWSYGALRGGEIDLWQKQVAAMPAERMVEALRAKGFRAVYLDRFGYADKAVAMERALTRLLGPPFVTGFLGRILVHRLDAPQQLQAANPRLPNG